MNQLLEKFNEYKSIVNYRMEYEFENGDVINFKLKQTDFPHLIGLHKLIDIPVIRQFNDKNNKTVSAKFIISKIKKEEQITEDIIRHSSYFAEIQQRFEFFSKENILTLTYTDAVIDFDATRIGSNLKATYILYEQKGVQGYNHLCVAEDLMGKKYVESFFYNPTNLYIRNQNTISIRRVKIYDEKGQPYLADVFL
ncbi:MAG: hypothetical protein J6B68_00720 [Lachnospiraceae bacterium]|nr:hypothetical protein [Lachnospiraceae bacterium]